MNKTIIININGIVFHIEEDAYDVLKIYMTDVKRHFSTSADSLEITTDIENRIAEMFNETLARENKQVIVEQDVKLVIEQMGTVEDFEFAESDAKTPGANPFTYNTERRRLFRDPDDHLVAGVASGIANYFDIPAVWVRLAFTIAIAFAGTGMFLYIILWIVVPKATSRADRMAMKGEKQDLKGFKKSFEEELGSVRENLANFKQEAKPFVYQARDFIGDFVDHFGAFIKGAGNVFGKFIGIMILLTCFGIAVALIISLCAFLATGNMGIYHLFPFNIANHEANTMFLVSGFLILGIPLLAIILLTISYLFKNASFNRSIGTTLLCIWLAAIGAITYYAVKTMTNFREGGKFTKTINVKPTANNTYYLTLNDTKYLNNQDSARLQINDRFHGLIILDDDDNGNDFETPGNVSIDIEKSDVPQPVLIETFKARGRDLADALLNARNTTYRFSQADSTLKFDRRLEMMDGFMWRDQELHVTLKLPLNAKVVIDQSLDRNVNFSLGDCNHINKKDDGSSPVTFIMTNDGLQCKVDTVVTVKPAAIESKVKIDTVKPVSK